MTHHPETISFYRSRLPHWEVKDGHYFVTIRVAGSLPEKVQKDLREISFQLKQTKGEGWISLQRYIFQKMEESLDSCDTGCYLQESELSEICVEAISKRISNNIWIMHEYVIMPNHIHMFFTLQQGHLKTVIPSFKRWTGGRINKVLNRKGGFWQNEWFDHWARTQNEADRIMEYIRNNPAKAGLVENFKDWPYGSWSD